MIHLRIIPFFFSFFYHCSLAWIISIYMTLSALTSYHAESNWLLISSITFFISVIAPFNSCISISFYSYHFLSKIPHLFMQYIKLFLYALEHCYNSYNSNILVIGHHGIRFQWLLAFLIEYHILLLLHTYDYTWCTPMCLDYLFFP